MWVPVLLMSTERVIPGRMVVVAVVLLLRLAVVMEMKSSWTSICLYEGTHSLRGENTWCVYACACMMFCLRFGLGFVGLVWFLFKFDLKVLPSVIFPFSRKGIPCWPRFKGGREPKIRCEHESASMPDVL